MKVVKTFVVGRTNKYITPKQGLKDGDLTEQELEVAVKNGFVELEEGHTAKDTTEAEEGATGEPEQPQAKVEAQAKPAAKKTAAKKTTATTKTTKTTKE